MGYMGSHYDMPKAIFYLLKGDYSILVGDSTVPNIE